MFNITTHDTTVNTDINTAEPNTASSNEPVKLAYPYPSILLANVKKVLEHKRFKGIKVIKQELLKSQITKNNSKQLIPAKILGETKHYNPANKEWPNSVYAYNKNYLKGLPVKDNIANRAIKNYFYLSDCKGLARSRRMRSLIRKSTVEKLYTSKPEIKQTTDKVVVTIYTFDRERQNLLKKIYFNIRKLEKIRKTKLGPQKILFSSYESWRNKYSLEKSFSKLKAKTYLFNKNTQIARALRKRYFLLRKTKKISKTTSFKYSIVENRGYHLKSKLNLNLFKTKRKNMFTKSTKKKIIKRRIPFLGLKSANQMEFLLFRQQSKRNSIKIQKLLHYAYLKNALAKFGIKLYSFKNITKSGKVLFLMKGANSPEVLDLDNTLSHYTYLDKVNLLVSNLLGKILSKYKVPETKFDSFASILSRKNFQDFLSEIYLPGFIKDKKSNKSKKLRKRLTKKNLELVKKEVMLISNYLNLKINYLKFSNYLPALKLMISKIYNKSAELNLVNLKYPHLNTDIFTQAIATKLRKKVGLLKVIRRSLKLVRLPYGFNERTPEYSLNKIKTFNIHKSLKLNNLMKDSELIKSYSTPNSLDSLQFILRKLYPRSLINGTNHIGNKSKAIVINKDTRKVGKVSRKIVSVLNSIKYKWVTGVRLEAAGRLTRRYTASRSVYKFRYKGSLKNTDFSRKLDFLKKSMPVVISRNLVKSNSQYSFAKSKRRIGAFGIKGWISGY